MNWIALPGNRVRIVCAPIILFFLAVVGQTTHAQMIGEVGVLRGPQWAGGVPVFTDEKALDAFYAATARNDNEGTEELFNAGRLYMVDASSFAAFPRRHTQRLAPR